MSKQRLLFITTGGTIASVRTQQGLKPVLSSEELLAHLPELKELCCPETLALCSIDSTDLGQEHWLMMARAIQENYALYDGFIICHGTDTLAYSAAALSYLIQNADKPIILTGAQQPISNEITDAKKNLRDSVVCAIDPGSRGVMVVFGGHVIAGTRAKKNKTISYDAFASVNFPALALVQGDRLVRYIPSPWPTGPVEFGRALNPKVFLLKLTPGLGPELIPAIFQQYDCVIVDEAQFLTKAQVEKLVEIVDDRHVPVIAYGLRTDFQGNLFEGSQWLLAWADTIEEVKTICWCGKKATCNARILDGKVVKDGAQVMLGGNESYVSLCRKHWTEGKLKP